MNFKEFLAWIHNFPLIFFVLPETLVYLPFQMNRWGGQLHWKMETLQNNYCPPEPYKCIEEKQTLKQCYSYNRYILQSIL